MGSKNDQFPLFFRLKLEEEVSKGTNERIINPKLPSGFQFPNMDPMKARKGAVLILFFFKEGRWYFPLIQRPVYDGVHSGQVAFPGGRQEESDVDLSFTALREAHEEIGVASDEVTVIGSLSDFFVAASNHLVKPVIGFHPSVPQFTPDPREVELIIEAPLDELMSRPIQMKEIHTSRGYSLTSPTFEFDGRLIWGATAMMLMELKRILNKIE